MKINGFLSELEKAVLRHMMRYEGIPEDSVCLDEAQTEIPEDMVYDLECTKRCPVQAGSVRAFMYYRDTLRFFQENEMVLLRWLTRECRYDSWYDRLRSLAPCLHGLSDDELDLGWDGEDPELEIVVQNAVAMAAAQDAVNTLQAKCLENDNDNDNEEEKDND